MTKIYVYCLIFIGFSALLSSCEIEKHYHSRGYHIAWNATKQGSAKKMTHPAGTHTNNPTQKTSKSTDHSFNDFSKTEENTLKNTNPKHLPFVNAIPQAHKFIFHPQNSFLPPDSVIVYDTVFEEEVMIIPDSINKQHQALLDESKLMKQKSRAPLTIGYLLLTVGGLGLFVSALLLFIAFIGSQTTTMGALLIAMGVSILLLFIGGIFLSKGLAFETKSRILAKKAKTLLAPYAPAKAPTKGTKKSTKKILLLVLAAYAALRFATLFL